MKDVVAQRPSKARYIKTVDGYFVAEQCSCSGGCPAQRGLSLSKQTALALCSCHKEQAVKGACTVT